MRTELLLMPLTQRKHFRSGHASLFRTVAVCFVGIASVASAACGADGAAKRATGDSTSFAQLFAGYSADYDPAKSPAELSNRSTLVVLGRIGEIVEGRSYGRRADSWSVPTISVRLDVTELKKGVLPKGSDNRIYVEFYATNGRKAAQYDAVAPRSADVLLYLVEAPVRGNATNPIEDSDKGRPQGQPLWRLTTPQGFYIADGRDVTQVQDFEKYEGAGIEAFFPQEQRFPANPDNVAK